MKTTTFFRILLLVLLAATGNDAMAQSDSCATNVIHTYMNGRPIPWDSVKVKVQDAPYHTHSFMLYWPDTILANCPTDVDEYALDKGAELSQVFPNPCLGTSQVKLNLQNSGMVSVRVMDMQGRICCQKNLNLPTGEHRLSLTLPQSGLFFVQAETDHGSEACKVLCTEGAGSDFDIRLTSTSFQSMEKAGKDSKGGEGQFSMTDKMQITAYITYNGSVLSNGWTINYDLEIDEQFISEWMYNYGSINIGITQVEECDTFSLSGRTFNVIASTHMCLPTMDYPISYRVTFGDSTLYSEPAEFSAYSSSTWRFNGEYKYRYYPEDLGGCICIGDINGEMPPEHIDYYGQVSPSDYWVRKLDKLSCDEFKLQKFTVYGSGDIEIVVSKE